MLSSLDSYFVQCSATNSIPPTLLPTNCFQITCLLWNVSFPSKIVQFLSRPVSTDYNFCAALARITRVIAIFLCLTINCIPQLSTKAKQPGNIIIFDRCFYHYYARFGDGKFCFLWRQESDCLQPEKLNSPR